MAGVSTQVNCKYDFTFKKPSLSNLNSLHQAIKMSREWIRKQVERDDSPSIRKFSCNWFHVRHLDAPSSAIEKLLCIFLDERDASKLGKLTRIFAYWIRLACNTVHIKPFGIAYFTFPHERDPRTSPIRNGTALDGRMYHATQQRAASGDGVYPPIQQQAATGGMIYRAIWQRAASPLSRMVADEDSEVDTEMIDRLEISEYDHDADVEMDNDDDSGPPDDPMIE